MTSVRPPNGLSFVCINHTVQIQSGQSKRHIVCLQRGTLYEFQPASERPRGVPEPTLRFFKAVSGRETVLYSAIANDREPSDGDTNIIITAFDVSGTDSVDLTCCLLAKEGGKLCTTLASVFVNPHVYDGVLSPLSSLSSLWEVFQKAPTKVAKQYACVLPELALGEASHVALTSSLCPVTLDEYLPVVRPKVVSGGLAVCVKVRIMHATDLEITGAV